MPNPDEAPPLFRREALLAADRRALGSIVLVRPISMAFYTTTFSFIALVLVCFFLLGEYQRKVHVVGILLPQSGLIQITAPQAGVIEDEDLTEGSAVKTGTPLLVIASERTTADGQSAEVLIASLLSRRAESLASEGARVRMQGKARARAALERADAFAADARRSAEEIVLQQRRIDLSRQALERFQALEAQHYISAAQRQDKEAALLAEEQKLADLTRAREASTREASNAKAEAADAKLEEERELLGLARSTDSVRQDLAENDARSRISVSSPRDGIVMSLRSFRGQSVRAGEVLAVVYPEGSPLEAELYVPSKAAGFLKPDMDVLLSYRSFPSEKFGLNHGVVHEISGTAMRAEDMQMPEAAITEDGRQPVYRVRVALDAQAIRISGTREPLRPGMLLDARIPLERRRIVEWALDPLFAIAGRSL